MITSTEAFHFATAAYSSEYYRFHLNAVVLRIAIQDGFLPATPVPKEQIKDFTQSDSVAKTLVICQLLNFLIGTFARGVQDLPVSPLEVAVCAFVFLSMITYGLLLRKPQDASVPIVLGVYDHIPQRILELKTAWEQNGIDRTDKVLPADKRTRQLPTENPGGPPFILANQNGGRPVLKDGTDYSLDVGTLSCIPFGAIHLASWFSFFPTVVDAWLWRAASLVTIVIPVLHMLFGRFIKSDKLMLPRLKIFMKQRVSILLAIGLIAYFLCRAILVAEMIRTLFSLPRESYLTPSWSISIPHFG